MEDPGMLLEEELKWNRIIVVVNALKLQAHQADHREEMARPAYQKHQSRLASLVTNLQHEGHT